VITVVTFKWETPGYRSKYAAEHVNTMQRMVERHYKHPHRFVCVTDDPSGLHSSIEYIPIWNDYANILNPSWPDRGPSCYRRLKMFSDEVGEWCGERFVCIDLDVIVTGDLTPLWDVPAECATYSCPGLDGAVNGAMFLANAGTRRHVWDLFDPDTSPGETLRLGFKGSDQAWLSATLGWCSHKWTKADGLHDFCSIAPRRRAQMRMRGSATRRPQDDWVLDNYR
jgi:hypothetical protein